MAISPRSGGWTLDAWGGLHPFGGAPTVVGPSWPGRDLARAVVAGPARGGWVLDVYGGVHAFGGAAPIHPDADRPGQDLARALILRPGGGGWTVDAYGGVHAFGGAPTVAGTLYRPGIDTVRGAQANPRVAAGGSSTPSAVSTLSAARRRASRRVTGRIGTSPAV